MTDDQLELDEALRAWGAAERAAAPNVVVPVARFTGGRSRRLPLMLAAAAAVVVAAAAVAVPIALDRNPTASTYSDLVVRDGMAVEGSGLVFVKPQQPTIFCPSRLDDDNLVWPEIAEGFYCGGPYRVTAVGVDPARLTKRAVLKDGTIVGAAFLTGTYDKGALTVTGQEAPRLSAPVGFSQEPPCDPPMGGWPTMPPGAAYSLADLEAVIAKVYPHPEDIVAHWWLEPAPRSAPVAFVLTAGDPAPLRAALASMRDMGVCVKHSKFSKVQVDVALQLTAWFMADQVQPIHPTALVLKPTPILDFDVSGQAMVRTRVPFVSAEMAVQAKRQPAGLIEFQPWLMPVR